MGQFFKKCKIRCKGMNESVSQAEELVIVDRDCWYQTVWSASLIRILIRDQLTINSSHICADPPPFPSWVNSLCFSKHFVAPIFIVSWWKFFPNDEGSLKHFKNVFFRLATNNGTALKMSRIRTWARIDLGPYAMVWPIPKQIIQNDQLFIIKYGNSKGQG